MVSTCQSVKTPMCLFLSRKTVVRSYCISVYIIWTPAASFTLFSAHFTTFNLKETSYVDLVLAPFVLCGICRGQGLTQNSCQVPQICRLMSSILLHHVRAPLFETRPLVGWLSASIVASAITLALLP